MRKGIRRSLLGVLTIVLVAALYLGYRAYQVYSDVHSIIVTFPTVAGEPTATPVADVLGKHRINILVLGSDNDAKSQEKYPLTQSMIVVSIDPVHDQVNMLSIPRDFYVHIPGFGMDKIDVAAKDGGKNGISLARATVEEILHRKIDYTAWVGLNGFRNVIDTFGGVTIDVMHPVVDDFYPDDTQPGNPYAYTRIFIAPGWRHLSGRQALQYVRSRHADAVGDFGRSQRQQELLLALRQRANGWDILFKIPAIAGDLRGEVKTDLSLTQVLDLARLSRHIDMAHIHRYVLQAPTYSAYAWRTIGGISSSVLLPNWSRIDPLLNRIFAPVVVSEPAPAKHLPSHPNTTSTPVTRQRGAKGLTRGGHASSPHPFPTPQASAPRELPGRILYAAGGTFYVMDRNGNTSPLFGPHVQSYMNAADMPTLSPDGKSVVFLRFSRYATDLYRYALGTDKDPVKITNDRWNDPRNIHDNVWAVFPEWGGNGQTILYSSDLYKRSTTPSDARPIDLAIYAMNPDGSNVRQLTTPMLRTGGDTDPQWLGTSTRFLYDHWEYAQQDGLSVGQEYSQLAVTDLNDPSRVWYLNGPGTQIMQPAVDRTGTRVAYVQASGTESSNLVTGRIVETSSGPQLRGEHVLATGKVAQPSFSPDGKWVSYLRADGDGFSLWIVSASGGQAFKLSQAGTGLDSLSRPIWFP